MPERDSRQVAQEAGGTGATAPTSDERPACAPPVPGLPSQAFSTGTIIAERYRIVASLGSGGMGEVYRADDLLLDTPVALKFLPIGVGDDPVRLERFHEEVRLARRVAHPNVCRVYDIVEAKGRHFISMEYIDGEDLAATLTRFGPMTSDRAVEIARQLCAGLAAAHDQGVIHCDLKPANVMIDKRGVARITDFGIAAAESKPGHTDPAGTPAYMAPEQLRGVRATRQSDLFSLGLVLYEMFTGRRAIDARSLAEVRRLHEVIDPGALFSSVADLNPAVRRVITWCLRLDPEDRPPSALALLVALPGEDPLVQLVAAGRTPSPGMVAAARRAGRLSPEAACVILASIVVTTVLSLVLANAWSFHKRFGGVLPRAVLRHEARQIAASLSHDPAAYSVSAYSWNVEHRRGVKAMAPVERVAYLGADEPGLIRFWYRESPRPIVPALTLDLPASMFAQPRPENPPMRHAGEMLVVLDGKGRTREYRALTAPMDDPRETRGEAFDWKPLLTSAGFSPEELTPDVVRYHPPVVVDGRRAWRGVYPENPEVPVRIEAGTREDQPVFFRVFEPWDVRHFEAQAERRNTEVSGQADLMLGILYMSAFVGCVALAIRNLILRRGDRRGAAIVGIAAFVVSPIVWGLYRGSTGDPATEIGLIGQWLQSGLYYAMTAWVLYMGLEPSIRRHFPDLLVSWSRLLSGRWRDPLVGRDVLVGVAGSCVVWIVNVSIAALARVLAGPGVIVPPGILVNGNPIESNSQAAAWIPFGPVVGIRAALINVFILVVARWIFPRPKWLPVVFFVLSTATLNSLAGWGLPPLYRAAAAIAVSVCYVPVLLRAGLLGLTTMLAFSVASLSYNFTLDTDAWYFPQTVMFLAAIGIVATGAAWVATADRTGVSAVEVVGGTR